MIILSVNYVKWRDVKYGYKIKLDIYIDIYRLVSGLLHQLLADNLQDHAASIIGHMRLIKADCLAAT